MTRSPARRIAVLNPDSLGDLVLRQPLFAAVAPQADMLVLVVRPGLIPAAERLTPDAMIVPLPVDPYALTEPDPLHVARVVEELRTLGVDTVVAAAHQRTRFDELVVESLPETTRIGFAGQRYPAHTPSAQPTGWAERLTHAVAAPDNEHEWLKNRRLAAAILGHAPPWPRPRLTATPRELDAAARLLAARGVAWQSFHVACLGASDRVEDRSWPADRWAAVLGHAIREHGWRFVLVGTPDEREGNTRIMQLLAAAGQGGSGVAWLDTTIEFDALLGLLDRAAGYVGRDSGPMHLAAALGKPTISVTGGGTWPRFVPLAPAGAAFSLDVPCAGCGWFCHLDECSCVTQVPVEPVLEAVDAVAAHRLTDVAVAALPRTASLAVQMEREAARNGRNREWELQRAVAQLRRPPPPPAAPQPLRPRVFLGMPFYGAGNIGDDLALAGFLDAWRRLGSPATLVAAIPFPVAPQAQRFPDIEWHTDAPHVREAAIRDCDAWLALGGSPFQTDSGPWMLDHLARDTALCRRFERPMYFLGAGINDRAAVSDPRARDAIAAAAHLWIRDAACAAWMAAVAGADRVTAAADCGHVFLEQLPTRTPEPHRLGWTLAFEDESQCPPQAIEQAIEHLPDWTHDWLVQDVRLLPGGERWWQRQLDAAPRRAVHLRLPDYAAATPRQLLAAWPCGEAVVSSRYHALLVGAWRGSRLVAINRSDKLAAAATSLGCTLLDRADDAATLCAAIAAARPVDRGRLTTLAASAFDACRAFADRVRRDATAAASTPSSAAVEFGPRLDGGGWHEPERDAVSWFRWMGATRAAWVNVPVPVTGAARLRCDVGHVVAAGIAEDVQLRVDGMPLAAGLRLAEQGWTIEADLPPLVAGSVVRVEFVSRNAVRPRDLDAANADTRRLAIAVRRVLLEPASAQG